MAFPGKSFRSGTHPLPSTSRKRREKRPRRKKKKGKGKKYGRASVAFSSIFSALCLFCGQCRVRGERRGGGTPCCALSGKIRRREGGGRGGVKPKQQSPLAHCPSFLRLSFLSFPPISTLFRRKRKEHFPKPVPILFLPLGNIHNRRGEIYVCCVFLDEAERPLVGVTN